MIRRVVFDTNTVISALLFQQGGLAWLRGHWLQEECLPLVSNETAAELMRVLAYAKFRRSAEDQLELLAEYLPFCKRVDIQGQSEVVCRDAKDQIFLELARCGQADTLVTGDSDLLVLAGRVTFSIETPEQYLHSSFRPGRPGRS